MIMRRWATARDAVPDVHVVGKVELRPFSLGHHLVFLKASLPFCDKASAVAKCDFADVLVGVAMCGMSYEENLETAHKDEYGKLIETWQSKLRKGLLRRSIAEPESKVREDFEAYLKDGYRLPPVHRRDYRDGVEITSPWEILLRVRLKMAGFSESDVMNGYLPGLWYDYYCACEIIAADKCTDPKNWRNVFVTKTYVEQMEASDQRTD